MRDLQADEATVLRDGRLITLPAAQLVPGDVVEVAGEAFSWIQAVSAPACLPWIG